MSTTLFAAATRRGGWRRLALAAVCAFAPCAAWAQNVRPVTVQETDQLIEEIFERCRAVNRLEADMRTVKEGGRVRAGERLIQYESVHLAAPNRMRLENRGESERPIAPEQCTLTLVDGDNLWEVQPAGPDGRRETSRRSLREDVRNAGAANIAAVMLVFLGIDRDVATARELRDYYNISCQEEDVPRGAPAQPGRTFRFALRPLASQADEVIQLWYQRGQTLPWQVETSQRQEVRWPRPRPGEPPRYNVERTIRILLKVVTNREGLREFRPDTFRLPLSPRLDVTDEETGRALPYDEVRRLVDMADSRKR